MEKKKLVACDVDGVFAPILKIQGQPGIDSGYFAQFVAGQLAGGRGPKFLADAEVIYSIGVQVQVAQANGRSVDLTEKQRNVLDEYAEFLPSLQKLVPGIDYPAVFARLWKENKPATLKLLESVGSEYPSMNGADGFIKEFLAQVWLISMTPRPIISAFGKRFGVPAERIMATDVSVVDGNILGLSNGVKSIVQGKRKQELLQKLLGDFPGLPIAIGDSSGDWEMLRFSNDQGGLAIAFLPNQGLLRKVLSLENAVVFCEADFTALSRVVREFDGRTASISPSKNICTVEQCVEKFDELSATISKEREKQEQFYGPLGEQLFEKLTGA